MRIAALLCGLVAGIFVLIAPFALGVDLLAHFTTFWGAAGLPSSVGPLVWYAIAAAAILGGLLTLVIPGLGTLLLTVAGLAWVGIGIGDAELMRYELLVPAAVALLGALLAFIGGELALRRRRLARRGDRNATADWQSDASESMEAREAALQLAPHMVRSTPSRGTPLRDIPLTLDDLSPAEPDYVERRTVRPPSSETSFEPSLGRTSQPGPDLTRKAALSPGPVLADVTTRSERDRVLPPEAVPSQVNGAVFWLLVANTVGLLVIVAAVGWLLVRSDPTPTLAKAQVETASNQTPAPASGLSTLRPVNATAAPASADVMTDPYAYCSAVKNIDFVDNRYGGPSFTPEMAAALKVPAGSSPEKVKWRCVDGAVYACSAFGWPACDVTPTVVQMQEFCTNNPEMKRLVAPHGIWACEGGIPRLPAASSWPIDARGFYPGAWIRVSPANLSTDG